MNMGIRKVEYHDGPGWACGLQRSGNQGQPNLYHANARPYYSINHLLCLHVTRAEARTHRQEFDAEDK